MTRADVATAPEHPDALAIIEEERGHARVGHLSRIAVGVDDGQEMVGREHGTDCGGYIPQVSRSTSPSVDGACKGNFPRMARDIRDRIRERLEDLKKSMRAASIDAGMGETAIKDLIRRPNDSPTMETIEKLARGLNTTAAWLAFEAGPKTLRPETGGLVDAGRSFSLVSVDGEIRAGAFLAASAFDDEPAEMISAPRDPAYPFARQIAFRVRGDSMNAAKPRPIRDGDFIICAAWQDLNLEPRDGLIVVVERSIEEGRLRERSVKALRLHDDRTEFVPLSSNAQHEPIVVPRNLDPSDTGEVKIIGLVRYVFDNQPIQ